MLSDLHQISLIPEDPEGKKCPMGGGVAERLRAACIDQSAFSPAPELNCLRFLLISHPDPHLSTRIASTGLFIIFDSIRFSAGKSGFAHS